MTRLSDEEIASSLDGEDVESGWFDDNEPPTIKIESPRAGLKEAYIDFCAETYKVLDEREKWIVERPDGLGDRFSAVLRDKRCAADGGFPEFWVIDEGVMVGVLVFRSLWEDDRPVIGGHAYVIVRPSRRHQGYGTEILKGAYRGARELVQGDEIVLYVDSRDRYAWKMVRKATFDEARPVWTKTDGHKRFLYRFVRKLTSKNNKETNKNEQ